MAEHPVEDSAPDPSSPVGVPEQNGGGAPAAVAQGPPPTWTREELRQIVKDRLESGELSANDVLADMYASIYATEQTVVPFIADMQKMAMGSRMGRRLMKRAHQAVEEEVQLQEVESGGPETE